MLKRRSLKIKVLFVVGCAAILCSTKGRTQTVTVDPALLAVVGEASTHETNIYEDIKANQKAIIKLQAATTEVVNKVNTVQKKLYDGLQQVSGVVKNLYQIKEIGTCVADIYSYESDMIQEAKKNPIALAFAAKTQDEMVEKVIAYSADISSFILKGGKDVLMDAGERGRLLYKLQMDVQTLRALAYYSYYKVHMAVMQGIINSLNPFKGYVDLDGKIVKDLLANWKH